MPPASLSHLLKLYPADNSPQTTKRVMLVHCHDPNAPHKRELTFCKRTVCCVCWQPVVAEHYDEVLFTDPPKAFIDILRARKPRFESPPNPLARVSIISQQLAHQFATNQHLV